MTILTKPRNWSAGRRPGAIVGGLLSVFALHLVGCTSDRDIFREGNPEVRRLQEDQARVLVGAKREAFLKRHVGDRVEGIWIQRDASLEPSRDNLSVIARAAAVSDDGYFLTAYHAVDDGPFYFYDSTPTALFKRDLEAAAEMGEPLIFTKEERNAYFREKILPGRLVWFDTQSDLALVRFEVATARYFKDFSTDLKLGQVVVATDDQGVGRMPPGGTLEQSRGNGAYFAAGALVKLEQRDGGMSQGVSEMVARKGMSGGAVVDLDGRLCGVVSSIGGRNKHQRYSWFHSIAREQLDALVTMDRKTQSTANGAGAR